MNKKRFNNKKLQKNSFKNAFVKSINLINLQNAMKTGIRHHTKLVIKRLIIVMILLLTAFFIHRVFAYINEDIIGAILFISGFSIGILYYYFNLFKTKDLHEAEYILSIIFVFFLTITMFAVIYAEPIENSDNYFLEFGKPTNINFLDAFYFSTTTITTLGYGDIAPVGVFRFFVILEVLMGLIYTGSMIYFILRALEMRSKKS